MKYTTPTGVAIVGTLEQVHGTAELVTDTNGCIDLPHPSSHYSGPGGMVRIEADFPYAGGTDINWDSQRTVRNHNGEPLFIDAAGDTWPLSELIPFVPEPVQVVGSDQSPPLNPCSS